MSEWLLDPAIVFLNHGSFGACPRSVLEKQRALREQLEREPVQFFVHELEPRLDAVRESVAPRLGVAPEDLAFVPNATFGVASVLGALALSAGDEILLTDHGYNACSNAAARVAERSEARLVTARLPFPVTDPAEITAAILGAVTPRTRLCMVDHVTSPTGMVLPVAEIVATLRERGVETLVDGAHGPGMLKLELDALGAGYYTGNFHKWVCAPKTAAFLHVRRDLQPRIFPAVTSHGKNSPRSDRSRFLVEFDWTGTLDPTSLLSVPAAYDFIESLHPDGLPGHMATNRALALAARAMLASELSLALPCPDSMIGALAALPLPDALVIATPKSSLYADPLQIRLFEDHCIEVPIVPWPAPPSRLVRISAQAYNKLGDYRKLGKALAIELGKERDRATSGVASSSGA